MGTNSKVEWTDHTFNPWLGCTHVSEACRFCYAEARAERFGFAEWGPYAPRQLNSDAKWDEPWQWNDEAEMLGKRYRVFCASMADVFDDHDSILQRWRDDLWRLIAGTPHLDWLLLTKRPENWLRYLPVKECSPPFTHVRLGVTIEDNKALAEFSSPLRARASAGWKTFVSYEPALGPVDWRPMFECNAVGWMIAGGESGPHARKADPIWFRQTRDQCADFHVPFHFKQWGEWTPGSNGELERVGKKTAGRLLDGTEHDGFPA